MASRSPTIRSNEVRDDAWMRNGPGDGWTLDPATQAVVAGRPSGTGAPLNQPIVLASNVRGTSGEYSREYWEKVWFAAGTPPMR